MTSITKYHLPGDDLIYRTRRLAEKAAEHAGLPVSEVREILVQPRVAPFTIWAR